MRVKTWHLLLMVLLSVLYRAAFVALAKTYSSHQHKSNRDYWTTVRTVPMKITEVNGISCTGLSRESHEIKLGSFQNRRSYPVFPKDFKPGEYVAV